MNRWTRLSVSLWARRSPLVSLRLMSSSDRPWTSSQDLHMTQDPGTLESLTSFADIGIRPQIIRLLQSRLKVSQPTQNQKNAIPTILSGSDVLLRDETGSGKTLGLVMAVLSKSAPLATVGFHDSKILQIQKSKSEGTRRKKYVHTLILVPTRDLALQITDWICALSSSSSKEETMAANVQCLVSGVDPELQKSLLTKIQPKILVGTPVRTLELFESNHIDISRLQLLILDEVDRLVTVPTKYASVSKKWQALTHVPAGQTLLDKIVKYRRQLTLEHSKSPASDPAKRTRLQVVLCSATINSELRSIVKRNNWVKDPIYLDVIGKPQSPRTLVHEGYVVTFKGLIPLDWQALPSPQIIQPDPTSSSDEKEGSICEQVSRSLPPLLQDIDIGHTYSDTDPRVLEMIPRLISKHSLKYGFIFVHASVSVRSLVAQLVDLGLNAARLMDVTDYTLESTTISFHEEESERKGEMKRQNLPDWIVLTEHEGRGLDLPGRSGVFILGLPSTAASYLHMSGRAGRAGKIGRVMTLLGGFRYGLRFERMMKLAGVKSSVDDNVNEKMSK